MVSSDKHIKMVSERTRGKKLKISSVDVCKRLHAQLTLSPLLCELAGACVITDKCQAMHALVWWPAF